MIRLRLVRMPRDDESMHGRIYAPDDERAKKNGDGRLEEQTV